MWPKNDEKKKKGRIESSELLVGGKVWSEARNIYLLGARHGQRQGVVVRGKAWSETRQGQSLGARLARRQGAVVESKVWSEARRGRQEFHYRGGITTLSSQYYFF